MTFVEEPTRSVPVIENVDVCVIGGGPGGLPAAIAAARAGARTLLVEMNGYLGGMATAGLVGPILGHSIAPKREPLVAGLVREFCERMHAIGEAEDWNDALARWGVGFNAEGFKIVADRMVGEAGVELLLHAFFAGAIVEDGALTHAIVESKSGRQAIRAKVFVDGTGDADVAHRAGAECTLGRPADGLPMAMGSMYHLGGLENTTKEQREAMVEALAEAQKAGLNLYGPHIGNPGSVLHRGFHSVNHTRFGGDCTDVRVLTRAELATRADTWRVLEILRAVPGGENLFLAQTPAHVGLRESRQVVGETRLTGRDIVEATKPEDRIARCNYWIDIHCPRGLTERGTVHLCKQDCPNTDCYMLKEHLDEIPTELSTPEGDWFGIPYRSLVPKAVDGLLVSGRCISADYQAMSATRVMAPCMAIGEAAGMAAAIAASQRVQPRAVDSAELRAKLTSAGALV